MIEVICLDCDEIVGDGVGPKDGFLRCGDCSPEFFDGCLLDPDRFFDVSILNGDAMDDFLSSDELAVLRVLLEPTGGAFNDENRWLLDPILEKFSEDNVVEIHRDKTVRVR